MKTRIVFCNCGHSDVIPEKVKTALRHWLGTARTRIEVVADLCELAARRDPRLRRWMRADELRVVACYPRVVKWLFQAAGAPIPDERLKVYNMRTAGAGRILEDLLTGIETVCACRGRTLSVPAPGSWIPWFPVIDYDRCTNCKQCLSFCLFGVYATDEEDRVTVRQPDHCKTNCPACARVCPNVAIMFPKYDKRPINGDDVLPDDVPRDVLKVDAAQLMEGDLHARLRARRETSRERFATPATAPQEAEARIAEIARMKKELDIPDDVIASLGCACQRAADPTKKNTSGLQDLPPNLA